MKKIIVGGLIIFSISQIYISDFYINYYEKTSGADPNIFYLPQAKYIKPLVLGYDNLVADIVWIKTISYFADQFTSGRDFKHLEKLLYIIADLDPMFEKAFLWGGSVIMYNGNWITKDTIMSSTRFLEYAWNLMKNQKTPYRHAYDYWRIPQMIGFNYAVELRDVKNGLPYIEEVSKIPDAPSFYRTWVSTLYKKSGDPKMAITNLERQLIIENLRATLQQDIDPALKENVIGRLRLYYRELYNDKFAKEKVDTLIKESERIQKLFVSNAPYLPVDLFFVLDGDDIFQYEADRIADRLFYSSL